MISLSKQWNMKWAPNHDVSGTVHTRWSRHERNVFCWKIVFQSMHNSSFLLLAYKHTGFHMSDVCYLCGQEDNSRRKENFTFWVQTAQSCRRDRLWNLWARGLTCWIQIRYWSCLWTGTAISPHWDITAAEDEEYCDKVLLEPHLWLQSKCTCCKTEAPLSPHSASTSEEDDNVQSQPDP